MKGLIKSNEVVDRAILGLVDDKVAKFKGGLEVINIHSENMAN